MTLIDRSYRAYNPRLASKKIRAVERCRFEKFTVAIAPPETEQSFPLISVACESRF